MTTILVLLNNCLIAQSIKCLVLVHTGLSMEENRVSSEQQINVFQTQSLGFREKEIDEWDKAEVEDGEVYICFIADIVNAHGRDFHN